MRSGVESGVRLKRYAIRAAAVIVALIVIGRITGILLDWLWFSSIGYGRVFWTMLWARALLTTAVFAVSAVAIGLSGMLAHRYARAVVDPSQAQVVGPEGTAELTGDLAELVAPRIAWRFTIVCVAIVLGILIAGSEISNWEIALRFAYQVSVGQRDPVFGRDIGFYLFSLPLYVAIRNWLLRLVLCSALVAVVVYALRGDIALERPPRTLSPAALTHGSALLGLFFAVMAWSWWLARFLLLYGDNGVVVGASYTDVHVQLPVLWMLVGLATASAVALWLNMRRRSYRLPGVVALLVFGSAFVFATIYPPLFERFYVKPSELKLETPYIKANLALTREAYGLAKIEVKPFDAEPGLTLDSLQANRATIDNIRLWDLQPLMDTYAQLQEIRTYYKFLSVDIDRYQLDAGYRQVMLSARELQPSMLPSNAQTWVNLHLIFTHGIGVVMSPVTEKSAEGLPFFYLRDIPPVANGGPTIREPRLYFGEGQHDYVIVKSNVAEFDYPKGADNAYTTYSGRDGVAIGGAVRRSLFAWQLDDPNILLSGYIADQSRILLHRNIQERVRMIAPFLMLDHDPYVVASGGRLF